MEYTKGRNLYVISNAIDKYITQNGSLANPDLYNKTSEFIEVIEGQEYTFSLVTEDRSIQPWSRCFWYDADQSPVSSFCYSLGNYDYHVTVTPPEGAKYARLSARYLQIGHDLSKMKFEYGSEATEWRPAPEDKHMFSEGGWTS